LDQEVAQAKTKTFRMASVHARQQLRRVVLGGLLREYKMPRD
jgi:hypothetical protein